MIYGRYDRADRFLDLYDLYDLYDRYDRYDLARVSGSETYILHGLAHVFWGWICTDPDPEQPVTTAGR